MVAIIWMRELLFSVRFFKHLKKNVVKENDAVRSSLSYPWFYFSSSMFISPGLACGGGFEGIWSCVDSSQRSPFGWLCCPSLDEDLFRNVGSHPPSIVPLISVCWPTPSLIYYALGESESTCGYFSVSCEVSFRLRSLFQSLATLQFTSIYNEWTSGVE